MRIKDPYLEKWMGAVRLALPRDLDTACNNCEDRFTIGGHYPANDNIYCLTCLRADGQRLWEVPGNEAIFIRAQVYATLHKIELHREEINRLKGVIKSARTNG